MKYKKSIYNVEIEKLTDERKLIYNTYSGIFGIMDNKTQVIFDNIESFDYLDSIEDEINTVNTMSRSGYIVDFDKDELATLKVERTRNRHPQDRLSLTIAPTMDCNMCCPYCFENKSDLAMTDEVQNQLIAFFEAQVAFNPSIKNIFITWFGGEPLMKKDVIYSLSKKFIDYCDEKDIKYTANVITNGVLLDADTAKRLIGECKIERVQITIDGLKENHNKRRILINGEDSWDIILQNIDACKDFLPIGVRVNVDKDNIGDLDAFIKYFIKERGWNKNPLISLAPVEDFSGTCLISKSKCLEGGEFAEINIEFLKSLYAVNRDAVSSQFFPVRKPAFCAAEGMFNYVIDPEGYFSNCYVTVGVKEDRTGHISKPFMITPEYAKWLLADIPKECEQCEYLPMCMGGCGLFRIKYEGKARCFRTYYTYKDVLKLAYEDYVIQKQKSNNKLPKEEEAAVSA